MNSKEGGEGQFFSSSSRLSRFFLSALIKKNKKQKNIFFACAGLLARQHSVMSVLPPPPPPPLSPPQMLCSTSMPSYHEFVCVDVGWVQQAANGGCGRQSSQSQPGNSPLMKPDKTSTLPYLHRKKKKSLLMISISDTLKLLVTFWLCYPCRKQKISHIHVQWTEGQKSNTKHILYCIRELSKLTLKGNELEWSRVNSAIKESLVK